MILPALAGTVFLLGGGTALLAVAGLSALVGLWLYEDAWVRAGSLLPQATRISSHRRRPA